MNEEIEYIELILTLYSRKNKTNLVLVLKLLIHIFPKYLSK